MVVSNAHGEEKHGDPRSPALHVFGDQRSPIHAVIVAPTLHSQVINDRPYMQSLLFEFAFAGDQRSPVHVVLVVSTLLLWVITD